MPAEQARVLLVAGEDLIARPEHIVGADRNVLHWSKSARHAGEEARTEDGQTASRGGLHHLLELGAEILRAGRHFCSVVRLAACVIGSAARFCTAVRSGAASGNGLCRGIACRA